MWKCPKCGAEMPEEQRTAHEATHQNEGGNEGGQSESAA